MKSLKESFIERISDIAPIGKANWELISHQHTTFVLRWRNDPANSIFFEQSRELTEKEQTEFINNYDLYDRIDLVLIDTNPIGVFSIKNLSSDVPEYGALIGNAAYRGKGIGFQAKLALLGFWFNDLNKEAIYVKNKKSNLKVVESNYRLGFEKIRESGNQSEFILLKLARDTFQSKFN